MPTKSKHRLPVIPSLQDGSESDTINIEEMTDQEIKEAIAENIKQKRRACRKPSLTAQAVADRLKMNRVSFTNLENGKIHINGVTLWKLAMILSCNIQDFFPVTLDGFGLSEKEVDAIKKEDEKVLKWVKALWPQPIKKYDK